MIQTQNSRDISTLTLLRVNPEFLGEKSIFLKHNHTSEVNEVKSLSRVQLFATPWTVAYQAPPSMGFSKQEYWSGLAFPSPGDLPDPGTEPMSPVAPVLAGEFFTTEPPKKPNNNNH